MYILNTGNINNVLTYNTFGCKYFSKPLKILQKYNKGSVNNLVNQPCYINAINLPDMYKNQCVKALNSKNPYEKVLVINLSDGKLVSEYDGQELSCAIKSNVLRNKNLSILHGHVALEEGITLPVSFQDFLILNKYDGVKEVVAFDKEGAESILRKTSLYTKLSKKQVAKLESDYIGYIYRALSEEDKKQVSKLTLYCRKNANANAVKSEIANILTQAQYTKEGSEAINKFWLDSSEKLRIEYKPFIQQ